MASLQRVFERRAVMLGILLTAGCAQPIPSSPSPTVGLAQAQSDGDDYADLKAFLDSARVAAEVPGLAFALFDQGGTRALHLSGVKNLDTGDALDPNTVFEAASISKPVFAYIVLSLVADGVLDLDAPLSTIVSEVPDLRHDARAKTLTPRMLLSHQSGLPNWRARLNLRAQTPAELFAPTDSLQFRFEPGERFGYSGEGYVLLQRIVEGVTGQSLDALAQDRVFGPLGMASSTFVFNEPGMDYAYGHNDKAQPHKWPLSVALASSTLHTTAGDLARFGAHIASQVQQGGPYADLARAQLTVTTDGDMVRRWGLGLGLVEDGGRRFLYHKGNNIIFIADFLYDIDGDVGYALLTNSSHGPPIVGALEHRLFGRELNR